MPPLAFAQHARQLPPRCTTDGSGAGAHTQTQTRVQTVHQPECSRPSMGAQLPRLQCLTCSGCNRATETLERAGPSGAAGRRVTRLLHQPKRCDGLHEAQEWCEGVRGTAPARGWWPGHRCKGPSFLYTRHDRPASHYLPSAELQVREQEEPQAAVALMNGTNVCRSAPGFPPDLQPPWVTSPCTAGGPGQRRAVPATSVPASQLQDGGEPTGAGQVGRGGERHYIWLVPCSFLPHSFRCVSHPSYYIIRLLLGAAAGRDRDVFAKSAQSGSRLSIREPTTFMGLGMQRCARRSLKAPSRQRRRRPPRWPSAEAVMTSEPPRRCFLQLEMTNEAYGVSLLASQHKVLDVLSAAGSSGAPAAAWATLQALFCAQGVLTAVEG